MRVNGATKTVAGATPPQPFPGQIPLSCCLHFHRQIEWTVSKTGPALILKRSQMPVPKEKNPYSSWIKWKTLSIFSLDIFDADLLVIASRLGWLILSLVWLIL